MSKQKHCLSSRLIDNKPSLQLLKKNVKKKLKLKAFLYVLCMCEWINYI